MNQSRLFTLVGFLCIGIISRFVPHPPNFTAINALALFGSLYFGNRWMALLAILSTMLISDLALSFHPTLISVYFALGLTVLLGGSSYVGKTLYRTSMMSFCASALFFIVSNFGVWLSFAIYPKTLEGLALCYTAAIPFFGNQVFGDITYSVVFFSLFKFAAIRGMTFRSLDS